MSRKALIVADMLNDFIREGGALELGPAGRAIIPAVRRRIEACRAEGGVVIFVADHHAPDDPEFSLWPAHSVAGTKGCEVIAELAQRPTDRLVPKTRYSAMYKTELEEVLKAEKVAEVELCGVCTSICVLFTAADLRNRYIPTTVCAEAVADFDPEAHRFALKHMEKVLGVKVIR